jgi:hypothetical protein
MGQAFASAVAPNEDTFALKDYLSHVGIRPRAKVGVRDHTRHTTRRIDSKSIRNASPVIIAARSAVGEDHIQPLSLAQSSDMGWSTFCCGDSFSCWHIADEANVSLMSAAHLSGHLVHGLAHSERRPEIYIELDGNLLDRLLIIFSCFECLDDFLDVSAPTIQGFLAFG